MALFTSSWKQLLADYPPKTADQKLHAACEAFADKLTTGHVPLEEFLGVAPEMRLTYLRGLYKDRGLDACLELGVAFHFCRALDVGPRHRPTAPVPELESVLERVKRHPGAASRMSEDELRQLLAYDDVTLGRALGPQKIESFRAFCAHQLRIIPLARSSEIMRIYL